MKTAKKLLCIILSCIMTMLTLSVFVSAEETKELQFGSDGRFRILVFADIQDDAPVKQTTIRLMKESLAKVKPDLVVYLGDNVVGEGAEDTVKEIIAPTVAAEVPFAFVYGNHDPEFGEKEELYSYYKEAGGDLCLTTDAAPEIYGFGNSNLTVKSSDGKKTAFNLWFIDSGSTNPDKEVGGYDYVHEDQVNWIKDTAENLKKQNGGEYVPSILFQHIIMPEVYEILYPKLPFNIGKDYTMNGTSYLPVPFFSRHTGIILEPCSPSFNSVGQFDVCAQTGVIGTFHGHDHVNDFTTNYKGVHIVNIPTVGGQAYSDAISRGVGVITLDESDLTAFDYKTLYMFDMALEEGSEILECEDARSATYYKFVRLFRKMLNGIHNIFVTKNYEYDR